MTTRAGTARPNVVLVDRDWGKSLIDGLNQNGWHTIKLEGGASVESFFRAAMNGLPMDPPISGKVNWDALSDSLAGGLHWLGVRFVSILWIDADRLLDSDADSFSIAQELLDDVASCLEHERQMRRTDSHLRSFLLGKGLPFRELDVAHLQRPNA